MMNNFESLLTKILEFVLALGLLAIALIIVTLVVLRYAFNSSITGANETITILFVYTTAIGAAVAIGQREHISISAVVDRLPIRTQRFIDGGTLVCIAVLNATLVVLSIRWIYFTGHFLMPATGLPRIVAQLCLPIGCGLAVFYCITRLVQLLTDDSKSRGTNSERGTP